MAILRTILGACAVLGGVAITGVALLAHGGRWSERLDVLTHFAPIYGLAAVLTLAVGVFASAGPLRWAAILLPAAGATASLALMAPEFVSSPRTPPPRPGAPTFKVIQFNAWGRNASGAAAAKWLLAQEADAIIVPEASQVGHALSAAGYHQSCTTCGVTVFVREKPRWMDPPDHRTTSHPYLTAAAVDDPDGEILVIGVHRAWPTRIARTRTDRDELTAFLKGRDQSRVILAGDFNSTPWSFQRKREDARLQLIRRTRALATWPAARVSHNRLPAPFPYLPIDHVYAGSGWATVSVERGPRLGSDHYPVVVTLAPRDAAAR